MDKTRTAAVVACNIGWSDIGCWRALVDLTSPDNNINRIEGEARIQDSYNYTVNCKDLVIGVENLIVINTPDDLLVADKYRTQEVKHIYMQLKEIGHEAHKVHRTVHKPCATYTILEDLDHFKIKRLEVLPGRSIS